MWQRIHFCCMYVVVACAILLSHTVTVLGKDHSLPPHKGHAGMNRRDHHFTLHPVWSDEWMGKCVDATHPRITEETMVEVDPRTTFGTKRGLAESAAASSKKREARSRHGKDLPFDPRAGDNKGLRVLIVSVDNRGLTSERHPDRDPESLRARGPFASFSAAINEDYAEANGYDYLFVTLNSTTLHQQLQSKYNCTPEHIQAKSFHDLKYGPSSFHPTYQYMRASSWNKIPPLYHLAYEYGHMYDWVLYMDSDVTLNPAFLNRSMSDVLDQWQNGKTTLFGDNLLPNKNNFVQWGQTDLSKSNLLFLTNFPWRDDMPCAGIFMFRPNRVGLTQLQEWWNYNLPSKNLYDFMEQDALWYMKEADSDDIIHKDGANNGGDSSNGFDGDTVTVNRRGIINNGHLRTHMKTLMNHAQIAAMSKMNHFAINATSMSLIFEPQFHGEYHGAADIQFLHMANYVAQKMSYLSVALFQTKKKLDGEKKYVKHMQSVLDYHHLHLDILGLTEKMELTNNDVEAGTNAFNRKYGIEHDHVNKKYEEFPPTYEARMDSDWHAKDFTGLAKLDKRKKESYFILEHSGKVLNKYLIQVHGDHAIYLVMNNTRHAFPDWNTFLQMGFDTDRVLKFHDPGKLRAAERYIPTGVPLLPFGKQKNGQIFDFEAAKDKWGDQAIV